MSAIRPAGSNVSLLFATGAVAGNGADTTEDTMQSFTIPAGTLQNVGDSLEIIAGGSLAASTDTKVVRLKVGGTNTAVPQGATATITKWYAILRIVKTGANTQSWIATSTLQAGSSIVGSGTLSLTDTNTIALLVTGQNATNSVANSITCQALFVYLYRAG